MLETSRLELDQYIEQRLATFVAANAKENKGATVFVGDSITEFFPLKKYLGREQQLINRGIAGTDTVWLQEHLAEQVLALEPSKIFLMIGVNDIGRGYANQEIVKRISEIVATIRQAHYFSQIYLLSVLPVNENPSYQDKVKVRNNQTIQALNKDLAVLGGVEFINLYPVLLDDQGQLAQAYTSDGLHLSMTAYEKLAEQLTLYL
ncbi:SGNH/GDSL hydrolase family protein [Streptococcus cuniculipharyngis]|uniref:Lysophospholipase n=1 Tax=Streptococcus cuniculipharyngis TaxID=1562651 RepID=A0A5C5SH52_9STRE|nr:SGNH/GDSL hydrolase family protein [Streptococcus cuniculipharyngis]TWS99275.1 lysophospholipase [Streptococcus cuniculipharyngis]